MLYLIITTGSVTSAVRLEKRLQNAGIYNTNVIHTPSAINKGGCSYSVRIHSDDINRIKSILINENIKYKGFYIEINSGRERVYNAVP